FGCYITLCMVMSQYTHSRTMYWFRKFLPLIFGNNTYPMDSTRDLSIATQISIPCCCGANRFSMFILDENTTPGHFINIWSKFFVETFQCSFLIFKFAYTCFNPCPVRFIAFFEHPYAKFSWK